MKAAEAEIESEGDSNSSSPPLEDCILPLFPESMERKQKKEKKKGGKKPITEEEGVKKKGNK